MKAILKQQSNIGCQYVALKQSMIAPGEGKLFPSYFYWECDIKPTSLSRVYRVLIFYGNDYIPRAFILNPNIKELAKDQEIPHLYSQEKSNLCLYYPPGREWNPSMSIANDFVPWIYMWLMFFEHWLSTGEWYGGGIHFTTPSSLSTTRTRSKSHSIKKKRLVNPIKELAYKTYMKRLKKYKNKQDQGQDNKKHES